MLELTTALRAQKNITIPHGQLAEFCHRWKITELALFGSVLRDDFRSDSDVDILVTFAPEATWSLSNLVEMEEALQNIFGRKVDLVERKNLQNPFMRCEILKSLEHPAPPANPDLAYCWIVREHAQHVMEFTQGVAWEAFRQNEMLQAAVAFALERIAEASKKITQQTKDTHPEVAWQRLMDLSRLLYYRYYQLNLELVWNSICNDVPVLLQIVDVLLPIEPST